MWMIDGMTPGRLAQEAADRLAKHRVGVAVGVIAGDETTVRGAGQVGGGRTATPDELTLFEIGSVTKVFTGLTLARLALAGTVELDEPVRDLLPIHARVPTKDGVEITLRHLATHTAGLPRLPTGMLRSALLHPHAPDPYAVCTRAFLLERLARTRLRSTPGRRPHYSNFGAGLLGLALAIRTGTSYEDLVVRQICDPLSLSDTRITLDPEQEARFAQGHRGVKPVGPWHLAELAGAGALRSTAADLLTFARAHFDDEPSELAEAVQLCRQTRQRFRGIASVHLGWMGLQTRKNARPVLFHNGATAGCYAWLGVAPADRVAVVMLSNTSRAVDRVAFGLLGDLLKATGTGTGA